MDELGAFDRPATRLGFLISQSFRAIRIGIDTGLHLGLRIPAALADPAAGQVITPEVAVGLLVRDGWQTQDFADPRCCAIWDPGPGCRLQDRRAGMAASASPSTPIPPRADQPTFHAAALQLGPLLLRLLGSEVLTTLGDFTP
jgi:hypothetical protein